MATQPKIYTPDTLINTNTLKITPQKTYENIIKNNNQSAVLQQKSSKKETHKILKQNPTNIKRKHNINFLKITKSQNNTPHKKGNNAMSIQEKSL